MTFQYRLLAVAGVTCVLVVSGARADEAAELKKAMLAEWESLSRSVGTVRVEQTRERHRSIGDKPLRFERRDVVKYAFSPNGRLFSYDIEYYDEQMKVKKRDNRLELVNPQYKAVLRKPAGKNDWVLTELKQPAPDEATDRRGIICPWLVCGNIVLPDWITDDRFVIRRIERAVDAAAPDLVRVHFKHDEARKKGGAPEIAKGVHSGYIEFDRSRHYCVLGFRYERRTKFSESVELGTFQYGGTAAGIPVLEKMTEETPEFRSEKFGTQKSREEFTYKIDYRASILDEEFRLSHYGLPEPVGVTWKKPTPIYLWLLLAAGVAAALGIGFRYLARRTPKVA